MTAPHPDRNKKGTWWRLFYGRNLGPLLGPWIACIIVAGGVFWFETELPVFHEVVKIIYFIVVVILIIATGRWFRIRGPNQRHAERRHGDRRGNGKAE